MFFSPVALDSAGIAPCFILLNLTGAGWLLAFRTRLSSLAEQAAAAASPPADRREDRQKQPWLLSVDGPGDGEGAWQNRISLMLMKGERNSHDEGRLLWFSSRWSSVGQRESS
jgi:hypothetical protein